MDKTTLDQLRSDAETIFKASIEAVDPYKALKRFVRVENNILSLGQEASSSMKLDLSKYDRIMIAGGGKATAPMAKALEDILGKKIREGLINVKYGFTQDLDIIKIIEAGHPLPDQNGIKGTHEIIELLKGAGETDLILSLISGGGSALLTQPAGDISLLEKQELTRQLLECGASIDEINTVRKHISSSKGGQMARAAFPATIINLMLSDVVGDNMDVIASGPFVPDTSTFRDVQYILRKYELTDIPETVQNHIKAGLAGKIPETPKQGDKIFNKVFNFIIGSNMLALIAAETRAKDFGYNTIILSSLVEGETKEVARVHTAIGKEIIKTGKPVSPPACIISGGETTVTIGGKGLGGRNQEFCLSAALDIKDSPHRIVIMSAGTDGNDGPTEAAGAIVDPITIKRGEERGMDAGVFLKDNDSYHYFKKTGELLITGPTNTNVMDIRLILVK
jgi:hydroxypyruvate reductase